MIEVMNWGNSSQLRGTACYPCGCSCVCSPCPCACGSNPGDYSSQVISSAFGGESSSVANTTARDESLARRNATPP
ncbi:MAG: hypothetical protein ABIL07_07445 [candidate division WOR-3 bacterium]